jgi:diacylglycerol kinase (ATP)
MHASIVHNPQAGHAEYQRHHLLELLSQAGFSADYHSTAEPGWAERLQEPGDLIVVAGGDGIVARVAALQVGKPTPLAILPLGTANNIATTLGLVGCPEDCVEAWDLDRFSFLDIGTATGPWGKRRFVESVGLGVLASTIALAESADQLREARSATGEVERYQRLFRQTLEATRAVEMSMRVDGELIEGRYLFAAALNIPLIGPNLLIAPGANPSDGLLDLVLVREADRGILLDQLGMTAGTNGRWSSSAILPTHRARTIEFQWRGEPLHLDDDVLAEVAGPGDHAPLRVGVELDGYVRVISGRDPLSRP